jgi:hypothetical protein
MRPHDVITQKTSADILTAELQISALPVTLRIQVKFIITEKSAHNISEGLPVLLKEIEVSPNAMISVAGFHKPLSYFRRWTQAGQWAGSDIGLPTFSRSPSLTNRRTLPPIRPSSSLSADCSVFVVSRRPSGLVVRKRKVTSSVCVRNSSGIAINMC